MHWKEGMIPYMYCDTVLTNSTFDHSFNIIITSNAVVRDVTIHSNSYYVNI